MGRTLLIPAVPELVRYKRPSPTLSIAPARHSRRAKAILGLSDHPDHADFRAGGVIFGMLNLSLLTILQQTAISLYCASACNTFRIRECLTTTVLGEGVSHQNALRNGFS